MPPTPAALPAPVDLGFPEKFTSWYADQIRAIDLAVMSKTRFIALTMPTGSGKSVTGIASALLHGEVKRAIYLTSTKGLQDQLAADFATLGLHDVRGQRNYPCRAVEPGELLARYRRGRFASHCDEGPCHSGIKCPYAPQRDAPFTRPDCAYFGALFDARRAPLVSTNYAMYFAQEEYAQGLGACDLLILDEAHDADKELESFLTIEISGEDTHRVGSKFLRGENLQTWKDWAYHHVGKLAAEIEQFGEYPPSTPEDARDRKQIKDLHMKLTRLSKIKPMDWILDSDGLRAKFCPARVADYAEEHLFRGVQHVILMSATMTRKTTQLLGIKPSDVSMWEFPSKFPVQRRPIYALHTRPAVRVDMRMDEDDKLFWLQRIDRLIGDRQELGWKGIIHTVSYQRMKELVSLSKFRDLMIVHDTAGTREAIARFKASTQPSILVSPSIVTGYDFPHDECRYQIIGKVPFPDMRGAILKARAEHDKEYAGYLAMLKLVQACGRGMRGPTDWCETFVVDDNFGDWFLKRNRKHAPRWFLDAVEFVESYPAPLEVTD